MIKAPMVTDCRQGIYKADVSTGLQRGHTARFLVQEPVRRASRMGTSGKKNMSFPLSCDVGNIVSIFIPALLLLLLLLLLLVVVF